MFRSWIKKIIQYTWRPWVLNYTRKDRSYRYKDVKIRVRKGVFHPGFFFSSVLLLEFIEQQPLHNKTLLELGCGAGLLSVYTSLKGAHVTATDISSRAVENTLLNAGLNKTDIRVFTSDLFHHLPVQHFDYIVVNPPYYPEQPRDEAEMAWYAGKDMEYFKNFFMGLGPFTKSGTHVYMILSQDCDLVRIRTIASGFGFELKEIFRKRTWWEWNFIYSIQCK